MITVCNNLISSLSFSSAIPSQSVTFNLSTLDFLEKAGTYL